MSRPSWGLPGDDDSGVLAELPTVESLIARMDALLVQLREQQDPRRFFHATYLRTTRAVGAELAAGGFLDTAWVQRWDVVFAGFYLDALEAYRRGGRVPGPWAVAFGAGAAVPPLRRVLLGMNAHINYDLPQALLAVISDAEFGDAALLARREADHRHVDQVLAAVVDRAAAVPETAGRRSPPDRLLGPANRLATKRFLVEARAKVWGNARVLARARRQGEAAYQARRAELERLATGRVADLVRPGPVLLRLATRGFGITLSARGDAAGTAAVAQARQEGDR
jgi:Family of unknown function (DUF5995)